MKATVVRNGINQGERYIEVQHENKDGLKSGISYAVPVTDELPVGTQVEITVKVVEVPEVEPVVAPGGEVSIANVDPLVIEKSPNAGDAEGLIATSPSGQGSFTAEQLQSKDAAVKVANEGEPQKGPLPEDFPGRTALEGAGINTYNQLRKAREHEDWPKNVPGVGQATADKIDAALNE